MAKLSLNNVTLAQEINGVASLDSRVSIPKGKVIRNIYTDFTGTSTGTTNSTSEIQILDVNISNPTTDCSYLIMAKASGYFDTGVRERVYMSLRKDTTLIVDTGDWAYIFDVSAYNDWGFNLVLNHYYEPNTSTPFNLNVSTRKGEGTGNYVVPYLANGAQLIVLELI